MLVSQAMLERHEAEIRAKVHFAAFVFEFVFVRCGMCGMVVRCGMCGMVVRCGMCGMVVRCGMCGIGF
jgi:hypothetical protein